MGHRLAASSSRYLRQHADNPVDWHPWGEEAFAEARRRDVPVFVSIGYSACHWCHVMAAESFSDEQIAETLNAGFVAIKVDREEHPDVDDAYMAATQALTGQGGWPMSVFTDPSGRVFHAGTYFPPRRRGQIPSFAEVLDAVQAAWTRRRDEVEASAAQIAAALGDQRRRQARLATAPSEELAAHPDHDGVPDAGILAQADDVVARAIEALLAEEDTVHGGFSPAPKFPPSPLLGLLLEEAARDPESPAGPPAIRVMEAMGRSALYDQVEGGFARYATDRAWALPHFEKMLADNAQLLGHYARLSVHPAAATATRAEAERVGRGAVDWLRRRMLLDSGLLASSLDADTVDASGRHQEGGTYLMSDRELRAAVREAGLGEEDAARLVVLNRGVPADETGAAGSHVTEDTPRTVHFDAPPAGEDRRVWEATLPVLRRRRAGRVQPARDEKAVAAWNAMAARSLAEAAVCWQDAELLAEADTLAETLWGVHVEDDADAGPVVRRVSHAGRADAGLGTLTDHAQVIGACFALASAGAGDPRSWLDRGGRLLTTLRARFVVEDDEDRPTLVESADGGAMLTAALQGPVLATPFDGPEPGGIAAAADALQQAEALVVGGDGLPEEEALRAVDILHHAPAAAPRAPMVVGSSLQVLRRVARGSPAFRILAATEEDLAAVRRAAVLHGLALEPPDEETVGPGRSLRLSVCLNAVEAMVCLPPETSIAAALDRLGERPGR